MKFVDIDYLKKSDVKEGMLTYISHTSDNNPAVTIKWNKAMQQIANRYSTDTEYMFPIITKEGNADDTDQINSAYPLLSPRPRTCGARLWNNFYHPEADGGISILDDSLGIDWRIPTEHANLSEKDTKHEILKDFDSPFDINVNLYKLTAQ